VTPRCLTANEWHRSSASRWNSDGYLRYRYRCRFDADGSNHLLKEWWSRCQHTDYWFIEESGRCGLEGDTLRIVPDKALKILRDKAKAEPAAYRNTFKDLYQRTLILTRPRAGRPSATARRSRRPVTAGPTTTSRRRTVGSGPRRRTARAEHWRWPCVDRRSTDRAKRPDTDH
jgi:hypothetical protein